MINREKYLYNPFVCDKKLIIILYYYKIIYVLFKKCIVDNVINLKLIKLDIIYYVYFQVALGTGISSHYFNLEVIVPTARILGTEDYHVGKGSTINLICVIENVSFKL